MDFGFDEEQRHFQEAVRQFAQHRLAPRYAQDDRRGELDYRTLADMASLGLTGIAIGERYGGQGANAVTTGIASEEISAADFNAAYLILIPLLAAEVIEAAGSDAQRERFLPQIADGSTLPCFCLTEPEHGSDAAHLRLRAERDGSGWRLTGEKTSISLGMGAHTAIVFARTSEDGARGISAFYVDLDERYVQRSAFKDLGSKSIGRAALHFDGLPVAADRLIGGEGEGFIRCMQGFEFSRALIGLMCIACASAGIEEALAYARDREAFGKPIGTNQGVAFPLAEAATLLRGARWVSYEALWRRDAGLPHRVEASMAKWWAPKVAVEAAHQALLTLGHSGYSEELPAGQRIRDLIGLEIGDGTAQIAKLVLARELLGRAYAP
ncbi:MAG TPA: acyl-CoA dehydrogenase family protein [Solirubrobacteraceae bacterium]|jgi:cyclohexanecarboxyl-CoA dehydrogenase